MRQGEAMRQDNIAFSCIVYYTIKGRHLLLRCFNPIIRRFKRMALRDRKSDEPHASGNITARDKRSRFSKFIPEASRIQTSLPVIPKQEILFRGNGVTLLCAVSCSDRRFKRTVVVPLIQIDFRKFGLTLCSSQEHLAVADGHLVARNSDDSLHVVLTAVCRRAEDDDVASLGFARDIADLIDDDVLIILKRGDHRISLYLERGNHKGADHSDNDHDNNDVEENIENVIESAPVGMPGTQSFLLPAHGHYYSIILTFCFLNESCE